MIELATLQMVSYIMGSLGVFIAAIYYVINLRAQQNNMKTSLDTRQAQLFMQILNQFNTPERQKVHVEILSWEWKDPEDFVERIWSDKEKQAKFMYFGWLLEGVGILLYKNLIGIELIDDLISAVVISYWEKYRSIEVFFRERYNMPQNGEWTEYLYDEIVKVMTSQHPELAGKTSTVWKVTP
jgi:hypothetical protein